MSEIKTGWFEELFCKFYKDGICKHKDAPKTDKRCIGMIIRKSDEGLYGCVAWRDDISAKVK